jgi:hypothetical protein
MLNCNKFYISLRTSAWVMKHIHTVIRFVSTDAKFGTCTVVSLNETLLKIKMRRFKGECAHFSFNKCPIYTHDGASAKCSTNPQQTDDSAVAYKKNIIFLAAFPTTGKLFLKLFNFPAFVCAFLVQLQTYSCMVRI